ncbi:MAG: DUF4390 domain-containing protein [Aquabacterium sp.]
MSLMRILVLVLGMAAALPTVAQGVEPTQIQLRRADGALVLDFSARLTLSHALEDALQRGVPMYIVAQASVYRSRWYWRDERVARVSRSWRLSYQPLTATWRVSLGGLAQTVPTLSEALNTAARFSGWRLADADRLDPGERYYVEFRYALDNAQLPQPMQIDLGQDWKLEFERTLRVEPATP